MSLPVGEIASLGAAASWAVGLSLFRRDVRELGATPVNLFKGVVGMLLFLGCSAILGFNPGSTRTQVELLLSGLLGLALGDTLLFVALAEMGAHRAALFGGLGPVLTAVGGWLFLGERLSVWQLTGVGAATAGVVMVVYFRPSHGAEGRATARGVFCGVASAACQAGGVLLSKRAMEEADFVTAVALRLIAANLALIVFLAFRRRLGSMVRRVFERGRPLRLLRATFFATFMGLGLMQLGIARTGSAIANALHSTTPIFTLPIAVFVLRERIGILAGLGSLIAVAGVVVLLLAGAG